MSYSVGVSMPNLVQRINEIKSNTVGLKSIKDLTSTGLDLQAAKKFVDGFTKWDSALSSYADLVVKDADRLLTLGQNQTTLDEQASR